MAKGVTLKKFTDDIPNEDAFFANDNCIAISDGAGGCGLFADKWSQYLINKLPYDKPIQSFEELDAWIDNIWESFYNQYERIAQENDGIFLRKFYTEGSYATIVAIWKVSANQCKWISYGDSVAFHYNPRIHKLEHSFNQLCDFSKPPYLISCKDPLVKEGFKSGEFQIEEDSVVFVASDALSHYILMMYILSESDCFHDEIEIIKQSQSIDSQMIQIAAELDYNFDADVIRRLEDSVSMPEKFEAYVRELHARGILDIDDYTIVFL
jgi:hypothetical protein